MADDHLISSTRLDEMLGSGERMHLHVLDVRSRPSRESSPIVPGSDHLDVNAELAAGNLEVLLDAGLPADAPLVFVCNTGGKSGRAASFLRERGFDAYAVEGGMDAWTASRGGTR